MTGALDTRQPAWTPVPEAFWVGLRTLIDPYVIGRFIVPGKPQPKERRIGQGRFSRTPKNTRDGEARVLDAFQRGMPDWQPEPDGTYGVLIEFNAEENSRSDLDNLTKLVWDALNTKLWLDDIQVGMALLRLVRYGDPGSVVSVFMVENNGTRMTTVCECGARYRSTAKRCPGCEKRRAAIAELLRDGDDEQAAAEFAQLCRRTFTFVTARSVGGGRPPSVQAIAEHLNVPESRARAAVETLITDGNLKRLPNKQLQVVKALGAGA